MQTIPGLRGKKDINKENYVYILLVADHGVNRMIDSWFQVVNYFFNTGSLWLILYML